MEDIRRATNARGGGAIGKFRLGDTADAIMTTEDELAMCTANDLADLAKARIPS